jgi:hypothetical protein
MMHGQQTLSRAYQPTNQWFPLNEVLLEKLVVAQLIMKLSAFIKLENTLPRQ